MVRAICAQSQKPDQAATKNGFLQLCQDFHNRKDSLFVGNPSDGRTATVLSGVTSTCRRHDVDPQLYLQQLLTNLFQVRKSELPNWLSDQWKRLQAARMPRQHLYFTYRSRYIGRIGREFGPSSGREAAKLAVLGCLTSLETDLGSLERIQEIVKLNGYANCVPEFHALPQITDAASHLLIDLFGDSGRHARTTVGVCSLPVGVAVEIDLIARIGTS